MPSCFLMGNRNAPENLEKTVLSVMESHIRDYGVDTFIVGHYGNFDRLSYLAGKRLKESFPFIKVYRLTPYPFNKSLKQRDDEKGDGWYFPATMKPIPSAYAIVQANRCVINEVTHLILYIGDSVSNTRNMLEYAKKRVERGLLHLTVIPCEPT